MIDNGTQKNISVEQSPFVAPPVLHPIDPHFYNPVPPNAGFVIQDCGALPLVPMLSTESTGSVPSMPPQMSQVLSSPALPLPSNFSPFGAAPAPTFVFNCVASPEGPFIPMQTMQISPRFSNPSPSPVPVMYSTSPLLMTPQQSTPSMTASDSSFFEIPPMVLNQSYSSTLAPPQATLGGQPIGFNSVSRTPERHPLSPNNSLCSPKHQIKFRERTPEAPYVGSQPTGYPPNYAMSNSCYSPQRESTPEDEDYASAPEAGKRQKRYGYRSKQRKIDKVFKGIEEKFRERGLFAAEKELVRGDDVLRIHVKTFDGLKDIKLALEEIDEKLTITRIAAVFSKKNRFQKKGFIIYLRLGSVSEVSQCFALLQKWSKSLRNIAVAKKNPRKSQEASAIVFHSPDETVQHLERRFTATAL